MALNSNSFKDIKINLVAISSYHHIKMNFKGVGKSSPLEIQIMVGSSEMAMVLSCGIEEVSSRDQRCNLCRSRSINSPAWPFVPTIYSFQANFGLRLQSCSQWMGGLPFHQRFPLNLFLPLIISLWHLFPLQLSAFIYRHLY